MTDNHSSSESILRLINDLAAESPHSDDESRAALTEGGMSPDALAEDVRERTRVWMAVRGSRPQPERRESKWDARLRTWSLVAMAASAIIFVIASTVTRRAEVNAQQKLAESTAQLVSFESANRAIQARALRNPVFTARILAGLQKLELSRDPDDRKVAIWSDLLPVLQEARKNRDDFMDVAVEYQRVLPLLRVRNPDVFLDSYWGELWILNILLDSRIEPVVQAARQQAPEPAVVDQIYARNAGSLQAHERQAFAEAVSVYRTAYNGVK
jgi:hypothetical protein